MSLQIKGKLASAAAAFGDAAEGSYDDVLETVTPTQSLTPTAGCCTSETPIILDVRPKRSSAKKSAEEDRIMAGIEERGKQSIVIQEKMLDMLKPAQKVTERTTYADWVKSVMEDLDHSLWRRFQMEHTQLLYKYLEMNDDLKAHSEAQQSSLAPSQQYQAHSQQYQDPCHQYPSPSSSWKPTGQCWPATVQPGGSVWGSQSAEWMKNLTLPPQLTALQLPRPSPNTTRWAPTATATSATSLTTRNPLPSSQALSLNLSSMSQVVTGDYSSMSTSFMERLTNRDANNEQQSDDSQEK